MMSTFTVLFPEDIPYLIWLFHLDETVRHTIIYLQHFIREKCFITEKIRNRIQLIGFVSIFFSRSFFLSHAIRSQAQKKHTIQKYTINRSICKAMILFLHVHVVDFIMVKLYVSYDLWPRAILKQIVAAGSVCVCVKNRCSVRLPTCPALPIQSYECSRSTTTVPYLHDDLVILHHKSSTLIKCPLLLSLQQQQQQQ